MCVYIYIYKIYIKKKIKQQKTFMTLNVLPLGIIEVLKIYKKMIFELGIFSSKGKIGL